MRAEALPWVERAADGPGSWVAYAVIAALMFVFLAVVLWACISIVRQWEPHGDDRDDGDGGGGQPRDPPSPPGPGNGDPDWWPEFERQFAAYASRQTTRVG